MDIEEIKFNIKSMNNELQHFVQSIQEELPESEPVELTDAHVEKVRKFSHYLEDKYQPLEQKVANFLEQHDLKLNPEHSFEVRFLTALEMIHNHKTLSFMLSMLGVAQPLQQLEVNFEQLKHLKRGQKVEGLGGSDSDKPVS